MKFLKKLFRKPAIFFVSLWAKHVYKQGVEAAEARHRREGCTIYLAANSFRPDHLVTYDREQFRAEKQVYGVAARLLSMNTLRRGCYYYTADKFGANGLTRREAEIRRKAFIKERLHRARLI